MLHGQDGVAESENGWGGHYHYHHPDSLGLAPDSQEQAAVEESTRSALRGVFALGSKAGGRLSEDDMTLLQQVG
jgi:hypothetical protein